MNEIILRKGIVYSIIFLLISVGLIPCITGNNNYKIENEDQYCEGKVYYPLDGGKIEKTIQLTENEIYALKEELSKTFEKEKSMRNIYENQIEILKNWEVIPNDYSLEDIIKTNRKDINYKLYDSSLPPLVANWFSLNLGNLICFMGIGNIECIGPTHNTPSSPLIGFDFYFKCFGINYFAMLSAISLRLNTYLDVDDIYTKFIIENGSMVLTGNYCGFFLLFEGILIQFSSNIIGPLNIGLGINSFALLVMGVDATEEIYR